MKEYFFTLILIAFLGVLGRLLLPGGEKDPLYPPLRFLLSLILLLAIFLPVFRSLTESDGKLPPLSDIFSKAEPEEVERLLLERSAEQMAKKVKEAFPEADFTLMIYTEKGSIPSEIAVESNTNAAEIALFLQEAYGLPARVHE